MSEKLKWIECENNQYSLHTCINKKRRVSAYNMYKGIKYSGCVKENNIVLKEKRRGDEKWNGPQYSGKGEG